MLRRVPASASARKALHEQIEGLHNRQFVATAAGNDRRLHRSSPAYHVCVMALPYLVHWKPRLSIYFSHCTIWNRPADMGILS
jgi:hypothetical protein